MKVTEKKIDDNTVELEAVATPEEVDRAFRIAELGFAQQMSLQPEGEKTIAELAEKQLGIKDIDMVINVQVPELLTPFAMDKKNIMPAHPPETTAKGLAKRGQSLAFSARVAVKPEYELESYDPISISVQPFKVNEREVDEQIEKLAERYVSYEDADPHPVGKGDHCLLAIEAKMNGEPMPALTTEGRPYSAGEGLMPDGFDENIIGMDVGETKTFTFEGPGLDDENNPTMDEIECTVTVKAIQNEVVPTIDEEWITKNMPLYKSYDAFRKEIEDGITQQQKAEYDNYRKQVAVAELGKRFKGRIADEVYEATKENMMMNIRADLQKSGTTIEQFMEQNGGEQQFNMMMMMQIRDTLVQGYALDSLFRHEKLSISNEDLIEAAKVLNPQYPEEMKKEMEATGRGFALRELAERMVANQWLLDHAEITVVEQK